VVGVNDCAQGHAPAGNQLQESMTRSYQPALVISSILVACPAPGDAAPGPRSLPAPTATATTPAATPRGPGAPSFNPPQDPAASPGEPVAPPARAPDPSPDPDAEVIEVHGSAPAPAGTISIDAQVARKTAGALGEPLRVLALLPGVTTSIAASGYPIIRGTLPGESRFTFDGIEIPMLYHLVLGNQVIHPSFIGELELRAGGYGAEQGHMLGGLVTMTPSTVDRTRTELHANLVELGAYRAQRLSNTTSIAAAVRVGTLAGPAKLYDSQAAVDYVDQQARLVHQLGNGDELTLTSLGAFDYVDVPPDPDRRNLQLGFHRLDARWSRDRPGGQLRTGIQTQLDTLRSVVVHVPQPPSSLPDGSPPPPVEPTERQGGRSYGVRAYADGSLRIARWLTARTGVEAHHSTLVNRAPLFSLTRAADPFLSFARAVDSEGAWLALDLRAGPFTITPGIRADSYHADMPAVAVRNAGVDPRLAITAELPNGGRAELAGGVYSAPPQVSVIEGPIAIGPLPVTEGTASNAGLSHGVQAQISLRTPLAAGWQGNFAGYYRNTSYAVDFGLVGSRFTSHTLCSQQTALMEALVYRNVTTRAMGVEAMIRRELGRSVTGWLSYSLGKIDRDFDFAQLPHDYDQRHTLNAAAQWRHGSWLFGTSAQLHSGRPASYPQWGTCQVASTEYVDIVTDPTHLRRLPTSWRVDLRAEREYRFAGWTMRVYFEMQNASLTKEVLGYALHSDYGNPPRYYVAENTLFIPLPIFGVEADL
jgi:hypothetical protein